MLDKTKPPMPDLLNKIKSPKLRIAVLVAVWGVMAIFAIVVLAFFYPVGIDWQVTFSRIPAIWFDPYVLPGFLNPPWVVVLLPHTFLPLNWGNAVNLVLHIGVLFAVIWKYKGGWQAMLLVFTSPMMLDLARTNNIDWIPLLAFLLPPPWGLPFLLVKPQMLGGAAVVWFKEYKFKLLIPSIVLLLLSFLIWGGFWFLRIKSPTASDLWGIVNFSPFPYFIPLGLYLLYLAWQKSDAILGAAATAFLAPYYAVYSLTSLLALLACKYRREAFIIYLGFWAFTIVEGRRLPYLIN
jgi:hypothetical protein